MQRAVVGQQLRALPLSPNMMALYYEIPNIGEGSMRLLGQARKTLLSLAVPAMTGI